MSELTLMRRLMIPDKIDVKSFDKDKLTLLSGCILLISSASPAQAGSVSAATATIQALRMAGTITGGLMPSSDPGFAQMVSLIETGDYYDAAMVAVNSSYFPRYLPRRMAKEMMNPNLSEVGVPDNDATTFIVANLIGSGTQANISKLWSDNATYLINVNGTPMHAMDLSSSQLNAVNWRTDLVRVGGQNAVDENGNSVQIGATDVGGYLTLSDRPGDNSIAQYGFTAGTNLRAIEAVYEVSMGLTLAEMVAMNGSKPQLAPRFVPEQDPNFFVGNGQPACMSCHGGGVSNLTHGYATVADKFDFNGNGLTYIASPSTSTMKSLGSNRNNRTKVLTCNLAQFTTCNPDSEGASPSQSWDLSSWQGSVLSTMGWQGPVTGEGLNTLGQAVGQATLVYKFLVQRVISEICPLGSISSGQQASIAAQAQQQDSFSYIVAMVASDPSCR